MQRFTATSFALALLLGTGIARAQGPQAFTVTIDASTVQPVATGFIPTESNGSVIILANGCAQTHDGGVRMDRSYFNAAGMLRLQVAGQPGPTDMPWGALMGGFDTNMANYRYLGRQGAVELIAPNVGHELYVALNVSAANLPNMTGQITATIIYLPPGSNNVAQIDIDNTSPHNNPTGLIAGANDEFIVLTNGALRNSARFISPFSGSWFGADGQPGLIQVVRPHQAAPYGAAFAAYAGGVGTGFNLTDGGCWESQPADVGQELTLYLNVPAGDMVNLEGTMHLTVIQVPGFTSAVDDGLESRGLGLTSGPNPTRDTTTLRFTTAQTESALLRISDVSGRWVRTLVNEELPAGAQSIAWDGRDDAGRSLPAGTYFCQLSTSEGSRTARVVLSR